MFSGTGTPACRTDAVSLETLSDLSQILSLIVAIAVVRLPRWLLALARTLRRLQVLDTGQVFARLTRKKVRAYQSVLIDFVSPTKKAAAMTFSSGRKNLP